MGREKMSNDDDFKNEKSPLHSSVNIKEGWVWPPKIIDIDLESWSGLNTYIMMYPLATG